VRVVIKQKLQILVSQRPGRGSAKFYVFSIETTLLSSLELPSERRRPENLDGQRDNSRANLDSVAEALDCWLARKVRLGRSHKVAQLTSRCC
jgi:hypothetical protein